jgi:hypothetical protein
MKENEMKTVRVVRVVLHIPQKDMQDTHDETVLTVEKKRGWKREAKCLASKFFYNHLFTGVLQYMKVEEL